MQINPYLTFDGKCEEALRFYQRCLGGEIAAMMTYGGSPMAEHMPADWHGKIMHAQLVVDGRVLMASDDSPGRYQTPQGFQVAIITDDVAEAERIFSALGEGGTVQMPLEETFWAARFGMLVDRFGTPWMINCDKKG